MSVTHLSVDRSLSDLWDFSTTIDLLGYDFMQQALLAMVLLGLLGGLLGPLIVARQMSFAVHGASELSVTGAAAALLIGFSVNLGGVIGAVAGAVIGNAAERYGTRESAVEILLQIAGGERRSIVQAEGNEKLAPGDKVVLITTGGKTRVVKAP